MDTYRKIPNNFTRKFVSKVINRQYFHRKTGLNILVTLASITLEEMCMMVRAVAFESDTKRPLICNPVNHNAI